MQIETFKVFCDLTETESFTKAAQISGITQSAVSQQISTLERQFDCLLIERSKKKFRLTREGSLLYETGKNIIRTFEALQSQIQETRDTITGAIRLSTIYSIGIHDLPPFLTRFLKAHPTVHVHVEYQRSNQVYEDVVGNVADLGLVAYPEPDPRLDIVELRRDSMVLICAPSHPLARQKTIKLSSLQNQRFIAFEPDIPTRKALDKLLASRKVVVNNTMEFDNIETVKRAVEIEAGVSIVPLSTVTQEIEKKTLLAHSFADIEIQRPVALISKQGKVMNPAMREFIKVLRGEAL